MASFEVYLASLLESWESLAAGQSGAAVIHDARFVASVCPAHPVLNNAILLDAAGVDDVRRVYVDAGNFAVWSRRAATDRSLSACGFRRAEVTYPMVCGLGPAEPVSDSRGVEPTVVTVAPERIAELNGVAPELLRDVPGARAYATEGLESGVLLLDAGSDVNVSFVATRPPHRRRGLATAVLSHALAEARREGFLTSSLQATPGAETLYAALGYHRVGRWQEWRR